MINITTNDIDNSLINTLNSFTTYVLIGSDIFILIAENLDCIGNIIVFRLQVCFIYFGKQLLVCLFFVHVYYKVVFTTAFEPIGIIREFISLFMY